MKRMLSLAVMCALVSSQSAGLLAQAQNPNAPKAATGVISGVVSSTTGRALSNITMQLLDARGLPVGKSVTTSRDGTFSFAPIAYQTFTLQCLQDGKVLGTASVILTSATQSVRMTCASDDGAADKPDDKFAPGPPWWKKAGVLTGLIGAAVGTAAIVATKGDASGSR